MTKEIDEAALMKRLAYPTGGTSWDLPSFGILKVHAKGDERELRDFLSPTPFELASDSILVTCSDSRSGEWYKDGEKLPFQGYLLAQVSVMVLYGDQVGSFALATLGNDWRNLMGNMQFLGQPAKPAHIALDASADRVEAVVEGGVLGQPAGELLRFGLERSDAAGTRVPEVSWPSQYFTIRMVPTLIDRSKPLTFLEILAVEGGVFTGSESLAGDAFVAVSPNLLGGAFTIREVTGATFNQGRQDFTEGYTFTRLHHSTS